MKILMNVIPFILKLLGNFAILVLALFVVLIIGIAFISSDQIDVCMDVGYCKEGLLLNIEGKKIIINKQTCIENNGKWYNTKNVCKFDW